MRGLQLFNKIFQVGMLPGSIYIYLTTCSKIQASAPATTRARYGRTLFQVFREKIQTGPPIQMTPASTIGHVLNIVTVIIVPANVQVKIVGSIVMESRVPNHV